jgi:hypothetical protein
VSDFDVFVGKVRDCKSAIADASAALIASDEQTQKILRNRDALEAVGKDVPTELNIVRTARQKAEANKQSARAELNKLFVDERARWEAAKNSAWARHFKAFEDFKVRLVAMADSVKVFSENIRRGDGALGEDALAIDKWAAEFSAAAIEHGANHSVTITDNPFDKIIFTAMQSAVRDSRALAAFEDLRVIVRLPTPPTPPVPAKFIERKGGR